jgi:hypothetical protein
MFSQLINGYNALLSGVVKLAIFLRVFAKKVTALPRPMQQFVMFLLATPLM